MVFVITLSLFAIAMLGMGLGLIVSGRALKGSCGGNETLAAMGHEVSCGVCAKKEKEICPSDDLLVQLAQITHPDPKHHR